MYEELQVFWTDTDRPLRMEKQAREIAPWTPRMPCREEALAV
jgi:hypothetical protein